MGLLEFAMIFSLIIGLYNLQQIKMTLKDKGFPVDMFTGWMDDYRRFKRLIHDTPEQKLKLEYQKTLNGLHFSLGGLVFFAFLIFRDRL